MIPYPCLWFPQPYVGNWVQESRIFVDTSCLKGFINVPFRRIKGAMDKWNEMITRNPVIALHQERALASLVIKKKNFLDEPLYYKNGYIALFSLSNVMNKQDDVLKKLESCPFFCGLFPNKMHSKLWEELGAHVDGEVLYYKGFRDFMYDPYVFSSNNYHIMMCNDLVAMGMFDDFGRIVQRPSGKCFTCDGRSREMLCWFVVLGRSMIPALYQNWMSQTVRVKGPAIVLRRFFNHNKDTMFLFRRIAFLEFFPQGFIGKGELTGVNAGVPYSVSGHIFNLLVLSHIFPIDFIQRVREIEQNLLFIKGNKRVNMFVNKLLKFNAISELSIGKMWHNFDEYMMGIRAYVLFIKSLGGEIKPNELAMTILCNRLRRLKASFPIFSKPSFFAELAYKKNDLLCIL